MVLHRALAAIPNASWASSLDHRLRGVVVHRATDLLDEDTTMRGAIPCTNRLTARALDRARHEGLVTLSGARRALLA